MAVFLHPPVLDLDGPAEGLVHLPGVRSLQHRPQERDQRLADVPGRGVPEVRRGVVDAVVVHVVADVEHRFVERGGARPLEAHALVARDVDDQAARPERGEVLRAEVDEGFRGVLERAVDDDVALGQERCERDAAACGDHVAGTAVGVVVELHDPDRVDGGGHGGYAASRQHRHLVDALGAERRHGSAGRGAEADHHRGEPTAVVAGGADQLKSVEDRAVARELVVLVEDVQPDGVVAGPVVHRLEGDQGQALVDRELGQLGALDAVRPAPEGLARLHRVDVLELGLQQQDDVGLLEDLGARGHAADVRCELGVLAAERLAVPFLERDPGSELGFEACQVVGVDREPVLVLLRGASDDPESEQAHRFFGWICSVNVSE